MARALPRRGRCRRFDSCPAHVNETERHVEKFALALAALLSDILPTRPPPEPVPPPPLAYGLKDSAQLLGIGLTTLKELISAGRIRTLEIGRRRIIRHDELMRFLDGLERR